MRTNHHAATSDPLKFSHTGIKLLKLTLYVPHHTFALERNFLDTIRVFNDIRQQKWTSLIRLAFTKFQSIDKTIFQPDEWMLTVEHAKAF